MIAGPTDERLLAYVRGLGYKSISEAMRVLSVTRQALWKAAHAQEPLEYVAKLSRRAKRRRPSPEYALRPLARRVILAPWLTARRGA